MSGALDPKTRTLCAEIDLPNPNGKLMPGMYGTVVIRPEEAPPPGASDKPKREIRLPFDPTATTPVGVIQVEAPAEAKDTSALKKALVEAAQTTYKQDLARMKGLQGSSPEDLYVWSRRWLDAEMDLAANKDEKVASHHRHLDRMKEVEKMAKAMAVTGQGRQSDATAATYYRTQAELWLTRAQGQ